MNDPPSTHILAAGFSTYWIFFPIQHSIKKALGNQPKQIHIENEMFAPCMVGTLESQYLKMQVILDT